MEVLPCETGVVLPLPKSVFVVGNKAMWSVSCLSNTSLRVPFSTQRLLSGWAVPSCCGGTPGLAVVGEKVVLLKAVPTVSRSRRRFGDPNSVSSIFKSDNNVAASFL